MAYLGEHTFSKAVDDDGDPDYVYYNATISNNSTNIGYDSANPALRFQETRSIPIVKDASKYNFSITRFTMNGANKDLPLFIPTIRTGADNPTNDVNLTIYSVSMELDVNYTVAGTPYTNTFSTTQPIIYISETLDLTKAPVPIPSTCQTGQDLSTRYYWVYTYSHWMDLTNNAFAACIVDLQAQFAVWWNATVPMPPPVPTLQTAPVDITYNPATNLFTLYCDRVSFGGAARLSAGTAADETARLYFNNNMFGMYSNFDNQYVNLPSEKTNLIKVYSILYQNILTVASPPAPAAKSYWIMQQDYESTSTLWSPIESIVFTSTLLPLVFEQTGDPVRFGDSLIGTTGNTQSAFQPIITDVALTNTNANDYRSYIQYAPTAEYRLASFQRSKQSINNIDIQVYFKNRLDGQLYPIQLFNQGSVSVKMMFRRRGIFDYPHPAKGGVDV
jgi:hypothetical protein